MPVRIQRKRTRGWRMPEGAVYVGRPGPLGNPFEGPHGGRAFKRWVTGKMGAAEFRRRNVNRPWCMHFDWKRTLDDIKALRGCDVACWCGAEAECHGDVILELANK